MDIDNYETEGLSIEKMYRYPQGFIVCLNLLAWQSFRWYLWLLVTTLPLHEDIAVETDDTDFMCMDYQTVPYCEIMLLDSKDRLQPPSDLNYT